ncbi:TPR repeat-containing protein [Nostoc sp. NIES-3756]|uniref:S1 family peptidase n=1 Tax=Nostoc sp. NIES-3756 TaxID=1751286 RepID=UPI000722B19B|nr:serine protease [Nostoc sp. NIES-3756]BAT51893.1 TPR repeat-containing protein [Nostoc sp. NIES-3756]
MNRFYNLSSVLMGTAVVASVVITQPVFAQSAKDVAKVAIPTTVQINNTLSPGDSGSGVIIAKNGNTYTVLTANHVVKNPNSEYIIRTYNGKEYTVTTVQSLSGKPGNLDLAIAKFDSKDDLAIAPLANSDETSIGSGVYVSGYPLPAKGGTEREYAFTNGQVTNIRPSNNEGYTMRYDAVTRRGMSGGPVFDVSGRVVGIHGQGDTVGTVQNEAGGRNEEVKTGLNSAIPSNTVLASISDKSGMKFDNKPPANVDAEKVSQNDVNNWVNDIAKGIVSDVIRRILPF